MTAMHISLGRRGVAATELALVAPVLLLLMLGTVDVSNSVQTSIRLERAARAGAQYALADSSNMAAVQSAVISAWPELTTANVPIPVLSCECSAVTVACTAGCAGGLVHIVTVRATRTLTPMLLKTLNGGNGNAVARLQ